MYRNYSKMTRGWTVAPRKVPKTYEHVAPMLETILQHRLRDDAPLSHKSCLSAEDPRRIAQNIAANPAPTTSDIIASAQAASRF